jgi:hypothetical protein
MSFPVASLGFPGIETIIGGEFSLSRGIYPSVATIFCLPQATLDLEPGTLTFTSGGTSIEFPGAAPDLAYLRKYGDNSNQRWSLQILDRRWRWKYGTISGEYNIRVGGTVTEDSRKNAKELADLLLDAIGESNYDTSRVPTSVYPYANWEGVNPAEALQTLCDYVACEVVLGLDNRVTIWPAGVGADAPELSSQRHPRFNLKSRRVPARIIVQGGLDIFQVKFVLEAIGREKEGDHKLIADLSFADEDDTDWSEQSPWSFPTVTDDEDRAAAFETLWRWWRIKQLADGGMQPPGCQEAVTELDQLLPLLPELIEAFTDLDEVERPLTPYVDGNFWAYGDSIDNTDDVRYLGSWTLDQKLGIVKAAKPILYLDSTGFFSAPTLYLTACCNVKDADGQPVRLEEEGNASGTGDLILRRPELVRAFHTKYDGASVEETIDNLGEVTPEAQAYVGFFQQKFNDPWSYEIEYADIVPVGPDGKIAQVKWSCHVNGDARPPLTHIGVNAEFDVHNLSDKQRRAYAAAG